MCIVLILHALSSGLWAQDWMSPIDHEIRLSGTFCELRTNHFHHGIDIKSSKGVSGDPIYAIADGFIHRLRVQVAGYGNSVYIKHSSGHVSVYGHLLDFTPKLDSIIHAHQLASEKAEIDLNCDSLGIFIKKGDKIGRMGSSGYSFGPHLHLEIRDINTETTINPLYFLNIKDHIQPTLGQIRFDYLTQDGRKYGAKSVTVSQAGGTSRIKGDTVRVGAWRCGLALRTQDLMERTHNKNGIYKIVVQVDSQLVYLFVGDSIKFGESRAVNVVKDFVSYKQNKERWYLGYSQPGCQLDKSLLSDIDLGVITTFASKARQVQLSIEDFNGNKNKIHFFILRDKEMVEQKSTSFQYILKYNEPNIIKLKQMELHCPTGAFYRDQYISVNQMDDNSDQHISQVISITGESIPFHKSCTLKIKPQVLDSINLKHGVLLSCGKSNYYQLGGSFSGDWMECPISSFGEYVLYQDVKPPKLEVIQFGNSLRPTSTIKLKIWDEFVSRGSAREVGCEASIDGQWIPLLLDAKSNTFTYRLRNLQKGTHEFAIRYWDHVGNEKSWSKMFTIN